MSEKFVFEIRAISLELGYTLSCEGILPEPLSLERLFEAVVLAATLGQSVHYEIRIFDVAGLEAEVIEVAHSPTPSPATSPEIDPEPIPEPSPTDLKATPGTPVFLPQLRRMLSTFAQRRQAVLAD